MNEIDVFDCDFSDSLHRHKLVELMNHYIKDEMGGGEIIKGEKILSLINGLQTHPSKIVLLASVDKQIVGLANCFINFGTFKVRPFINIHDIIIMEEFRGRGIGKALMNEIINRGDLYGCAKITLEVREDNYRAQELYKSFGFDDCKPKMYFWEKHL